MKETILNRESLVPIGAAGAVFVAAFSAHMWLSTQFEGLKTQMLLINNRLEKLEERGHERWTRADQREWALRLSKENATLKVPDVD